jgi:hypothetical protein
MNMKSRKAITTFSILLVTLFILAQFVFSTTSSGGGWCSPYLGAPVGLGHSLYQYIYYGFPISFVTSARENCFTAQSTTLEWSPVGLGVDGLLLVLIAYPIWSGFLKKKSNPI